MRYPVVSPPSILAACAVLLVVGCSDGEPAAVRDDDPALTAALAHPLLTDPDLVGLNRANSAVSMPPQDNSLPTLDAGPEATAAAREEALRLVGGPGRMKHAPDPREAGGSTAGVRAGCTERLQSTAQWAARLPAPFPVYPRGAVMQAAGSDAEGCALRMVAFVTSVTRDEVTDFYFTQARAAGYAARHQAQGDARVLSGSKGQAYFVAHVRRLPTGITQVELLTGG